MSTPALIACIVLAFMAGVVYGRSRERLERLRRGVHKAAKAYGLMVRRRRRRPWDMALSGRVDAFTVHWTLNSRRNWASTLTVEGLPAGFGVEAKTGPLALGSPMVHTRHHDTGDPVFDAMRLPLRGTPARLSAFLDAPVRKALLSLGSRAAVRDGTLIILGTRPAKVEIGEALHLARHIRGGSEEDAHRLLHNFRADPIPAVRARCLELLLSHQPGLLADAAAAEAMVAREADLRLLGAAHLRNLDVLLDLAEDGDVDGRTRVAALDALERVGTPYEARMLAQWTHADAPAFAVERAHQVAATILDRADATTIIQFAGSGR